MQTYNADGDQGDAVLLSEQITNLLQLGHSRKAERVVCRALAEMTSDQVSASEAELRIITSKFLPAHKKRHRNLEDLISRKVAAKTQDTPAAPEIIAGGAQPSMQQTRMVVTKPNTAIAREQEFQALVAEIRQVGFTRSVDVSRYIVRHRLGYKYRNISGILTMERNGEQWVLPGGFPKDVFARLCATLGLAHKGTESVPIDFVPFKDLE